MTVNTIDYQHFLSESSKARKPSAIRRLIPLTKLPGMISLGAGAPNGDLFPFEGISISLKNGQSLQVDSQVLNESLTYGPSDGIPQLNGWLKELQRIQHAPPKDFVVSIGTGSQDLVTKALQMLISPGDNVLFESPGYVGVIAFLRHQPCNLIDVDLDSHGVVPAKLREQLDNWPADKRKPKMLYTVPVGGNPTGVSQTLERKKEIYQIAREHNLLILEDDPYYYLQFGDKIPSYLSMDIDGRVLRFDSMSKILSSGLRVGWATGPAELVNVMNLVTQTANLQPSSVAQAITYTLVDSWGHQGFYDHTLKVAAFYSQRCQLFCSYARKHLEGLAEWVEPDAGMFVWFYLKGIEDSFDLILTKAVEKKVLLVPGIEFFCHPKEVGPVQFVRASFSNVSDEDMDAGLERLASLLRDHIAESNNTNTIDK
ncbi:MAG: pyridoxal phosphate-dependent transferase [Linnemannia elongata]|nr:MAG: pyridoxal phosphate-dependent transferase [Linnemannia elongata]